jgi:hypothetical protein
MLKYNKATLTIIAAVIIISIIVLWSWHKNNWWLLLGIPFSLFFFNNVQAVGNSLGYVLTFVIGHIIYSAIEGHFEFTVWSWFFFLCGLMSYAAACLIYGSQQSNWEKQTNISGDKRMFEEYERDKFLSNPQIKEMTEKFFDKYKKS